LTALFYLNAAQAAKTAVDVVATNRNVGLSTWHFSFSHQLNLKLLLCDKTNLGCRCGWIAARQRDDICEVDHVLYK